MRPDWIVAGNPGPFTLEGTRTFFVGRRKVALIDPGPEDAAHVDALIERLATADDFVILVTHGHPDHAGAVDLLAERTGGRVVGAGHPRAESLGEGDVVGTDQGSLIAVETPGHARPHLAFHWPDARAAFVGDLMLGQGDTTWVGEYPGCVADYLASLERIRSLRCDRLFPAHGPEIPDPDARVERYRAHRMDRVDQVRAFLREEPDADGARLMEAVYPDVPEGLVARAASMSLSALLDFVRSNPA